MTDRAADQSLISRFQGREELAVRELAERFGSRIYQLAMRQLRNQQDAEEVTQDVLLKVHQKIGTFRGNSALSSLIYRITFNTAMSRLRSSSRSRVSDQGVLAANAGREPLEQQ
jgi:RNA polymerase sigma-70 factor (ECF subfamily)